MLQRRAGLGGCIAAVPYLVVPTANRHKGETKFGLEKRSFEQRGHSHFPALDYRNEKP